MVRPQRQRNGRPGRDHPDLIVGKIQFFGPNRLPITPMVSAAQAAWAGGQAMLDDARGGTSDFAAVIDDSQAGPQQGFGSLTASYVTNPGTPT